MAIYLKNRTKKPFWGYNIYKGRVGPNSFVTVVLAAASNNESSNQADVRDAESFKLLKQRSKHLSIYFKNPLFFLHVLTTTPLKKMDTTVLSSGEIRQTSLAVEYGLLNIFNKPESGLYTQNAYTDSFLAPLCFHWLLNPQVGPCVERIINYHLKSNKNAVYIFKKHFLAYQREYDSYFNYNFEISESGGILSIARIIFNKINLLKLIRIILPVYGRAFWNNLSKKEQFIFSQNLIKLTRQTGSFKYLNAFLENDHGQIEYNHDHKYLIIYNNQIDYKPQSATSPFFSKAVFKKAEAQSKAQSKGFSTSSVLTYFTLKNWLKFFFVGAAVLLPIFIGSKNATVRALVKSTANAITTVTSINDCSYTNSYVPPLAMISVPPISSPKKSQPTPSNIGRSRTPLNVQAVHGVSLKDANRQTVVVFWDSTKANKLVFNPKTKETIDVLVYWTREGKELLKDQQWTVAELSKSSPIEVQTKQVYLEVKTQNHQNAYENLLETTTLGTFDVTSDGTSDKQPSKKVRNVATDLVIVDLANETSIQWSVGLCYSERTEVSNYILRKLARAFACIEKNQDCPTIEQYKNTEVFKSFQEVAGQFFTNTAQEETDETCETGLLSKAFQKIEAEPTEKKVAKTLTKFKSQVLRILLFPTGYQAAHTIPEKTSDVFNIIRDTQLCNHTLGKANGPISYDNPVVNLFNLLTAKDVKEMLTSNLEKGWNLLNNALLQMIKENRSLATTSTSQKAPNKENFMALILLRDAAHDFYSTARAMVGAAYSQNHLFKYKIPGVNSNLLDIIGPKLVLNQSMMDACKNNLAIANQNISLIEQGLNSGEVTIDIRGLEQGVGQLETMLSNPAQAESKLNKLNDHLVDLICEIDGASESFTTYLKLARINAMLHGLLTNKTEPELHAFVTEALNLTRNISSFESNFENYNSVDAKYLSDIKLHGSKCVTALQTLENSLTTSKNHLKQMRDRLKQKLETVSPAITQNQRIWVQQILLQLDSYYLTIQARERKFIDQKMNPSEINITLGNLIQDRDSFSKAVRLVNELYSYSALNSTQEEKTAFAFSTIFSALLKEPFYLEAIEAADKTASNGINTSAIYSREIANLNKQQVAKLFNSDFIALNEGKNVATQNADKQTLTELEDLSVSEKNNVSMLTSKQAEEIGRFQMGSRPLRTGTVVYSPNASRQLRMATTDNQNSIKPGEQDRALVPRVPKKSKDARKSSEGGASSD